MPPSIMLCACRYFSHCYHACRCCACLMLRCYDAFTLPPLPLSLLILLLRVTFDCFTPDISFFAIDIDMPLISATLPDIPSFIFLLITLRLMLVRCHTPRHIIAWLFSLSTPMLYYRYCFDAIMILPCYFAWCHWYVDMVSMLIIDVTTRRWL